MLKYIGPFAFLYLCTCFSDVLAQDTLRYQFTFTNAVHHECTINILLEGISDDTVQFIMSNSSPGRYADHEFAKNIYDVHALSIEDREIPVTRTGTSEWTVTPSNGYLKLYYTLYGNRADGTYTGIDRSFAHFNMPATILWIKGKENLPIKLDFDFHEGRHWKIATQLVPIDHNSFISPNLDYLMDSPVVLGDFDAKSFEVNDHGKVKKINLVINPYANRITEEGYLEMVKKVVLEQREIFGELPDFDFGEYTFLCNYDAPYIGDGMEHRNSTMITSPKKLQGNEYNLISTISHEFFHCWNIERIRPKSLEPFDFTKVNQSGELWFGEGFTEYYGDLTLKRTGIYNEKTYFDMFSGLLNYVLNSPGTGKNSPAQMSQMAPFTDASSFIDPTNFQNIFTSYYYYGAAIAFALDLSLRSQFQERSLDGYMKLIWQKYGQREISYTNEDLSNSLALYTGDANFASRFFERYINGTEIPDYEMLLNKFGLTMQPDSTLTDLNKFHFKEIGQELVVQMDPKERTTFYLAGLNKGDVLISINDQNFKTSDELGVFFDQLKIGDLLNVKYIHHGEEYHKPTLVKPARKYFIREIEDINPEQLSLKDRWLHSNGRH